MEPPSETLERSALVDFDKAIRKEWLVTNGLGGYASSTVLGINTRKYHGLLVAALHAPRDRRVFLEKLDEDVISNGRVQRLGSNEFSNDIFPNGYSFLEQCSVSPFPKYVYSTGRARVTKTIFMPNERNCVVVLYGISNGSDNDAKIRFFPLVNWRPFHSVTRRSCVTEPSQRYENSVIRLDFVNPKGTLLIKTTEGEYFKTGNWTERVYFREEVARGESSFDDCYQPGFFETTLGPRAKKNIAIIAVADEDEGRGLEILRNIQSTASDLKAMLAAEVQRCGKLLDGFYVFQKKAQAREWLNWMILAAGSFVVKGSHESEKSVIAGYHWFEVWGRDTFVSLPGLLLLTGRFKEAEQVFLTFAKMVRNGLIPNFVSDEVDSSAYNTVDATLWYVNAVLQYLKYTDDFKFVEDCLWETLNQIVESHFKGTLFGIHADSDGLLSHGPQLTWVDSSVGGKPVTPRAGEAVEIQGLWYNALRTMELIAGRFGEKSVAEELTSGAEKAKKSFLNKFWNRQKNCLYDVVQPDGPEDSLRPNQIITASLDFTMLDTAKMKKVVDFVRDEFLTPVGLRTLSRKDSRYVGVYAGDRATRDRAYHSGTVWPWLLGPFTTAFLRVEGRNESRRRYAFDHFLKQLLTKNLMETGLGTICEIYDGDSPHTPRGCVSQAWSVAEPLRAYVEDVLGIRPEFESKVLPILG
jgi:predicted glycogen debranching enzyme